MDDPCGIPSAAAPHTAPVAAHSHPVVHHAVRTAQHIARVKRHAAAKAAVHKAPLIGCQVTPAKLAAVKAAVPGAAPAPFAAQLAKALAEQAGRSGMRLAALSTLGSGVVAFASDPHGFYPGHLFTGASSSNPSQSRPGTTPSANDLPQAIVPAWPVDPAVAASPSGPANPSAPITTAGPNSLPNAILPQAIPVPEPSSVAMFAVAAALVVLLRLRRRGAARHPAGH